MKAKKCVFIFGGQGSQYYGMARDLYYDNSVFRDCMDYLDTIFEEKLHQSIIREIYDAEDRRCEMCDLSYSHPAIFMVQYSLYQTLGAMGIKPDTQVGFSLGEYVALSTQNRRMFYIVIDCIIKQIEVFRSSCKKGCMIVIYHHVSLFYTSCELYSKCELVMNDPDSYFIVSTNDQYEILAFLKERKIIAQPMPVTYGFHSSFIDDAMPEYTGYIKQFGRIMPDIQMISGMGKKIENEDSIYLWNIIRNPMLFNETMHLLDDGEEKICIDLSPNAMIRTSINANEKYKYSFDNRFILSRYGGSREIINKIRGDLEEN